MRHANFNMHRVCVYVCMCVYVLELVFTMQTFLAAIPAPFPHLTMAKRPRREWNEQNLQGVQLCRHFVGRGCKHGDFCSFAHSLWSLRDPPDDWPTAKSDRWQVGSALPNEASQEVFQKYFQKEHRSSHGVPMWAGELAVALGLEEAPPATSSEARMSSQATPSPKVSASQPKLVAAALRKRPHVETAEADQEEAAEWYKAEEMEESPAEEPSPAESEAKDGAEEAADQPEAEAAAIPKIGLEGLMVTRALLGWVPGRLSQCSFGGSTCLGTTHFREWLGDMAVEVVLGRWDDVRLVPPEIALVSVQCVGNAKNVPPPLLRNHRQVHHVVDFTAYAELQGPTGGRMFPNGDPRWAGGAEWEALFTDFVGTCELIMTKLRENKETHVGPHVIWFWCKAGRHRSAALLVMFLMWAQFCQTSAIIDHVMQLRPEVEFFTHSRRPKHVAYAPVLDSFCRFLGTMWPEHRVI